MNNLATLTTPTTLKIPEEIAAHFQSNDEFYVWLEGDTIHMKRVKKASFTDLLNRQSEVSDETPPTMEEISKIVHEVRQEYRTKK